MSDPMLVGLTYDLRDEYLAEGMSPEDTAEFDRPDTIEAIESALVRLGYRTDRIGSVKKLVGRLAAGDRWDLVFNIAEGLYGFGREAQVPALLDAYEIPYTFSDPLVLALTLHKGLAKRVVRDLGLPTPDFALVESESDLARVDLPFPLFVKPVAEGTGKGIDDSSRINSRDGLQRACRDLLARFRQPVLVERFLPGREYTAAIVGTGAAASVLGVMEVTMRDSAAGGVYSYANKENSEELMVYRTASGEETAGVERVALGVWRGLGCRDAGRVDLRLDGEGTPNFMEVNPLAGLHPEHSDLPIICGMVGIGYLELIDRIMESASERAAAIGAVGGGV